jgi:hypothetical protein
MVFRAWVSAADRYSREAGMSGGAGNLIHYARASSAAAASHGCSRRKTFLLDRAAQSYVLCTASSTSKGSANFRLRYRCQSGPVVEDL